MSSFLSAPGLQQRAEQIARQATLIVRRARLLGWLALASALWLWLLVFVILGSIPHFLLSLPAAMVGVILLLPGAVVLLTTLGLDSLTRLPQRLGFGPAVMAGPASVQRRGPIVLLRKLWALRREILTFRQLLVGYVGAVRLFTLPVLLLISLAMLACLFQLLLAVLSVPLLLVALAL